MDLDGFLVNFQKYKAKKIPTDVVVHYRTTEQMKKKEQKNERGNMQHPNLTGLDFLSFPVYVLICDPWFEF